MAQPYYFTLCPGALSFTLCYKFCLGFLRWCETCRKHEYFCGGRGRSYSCSSSRVEVGKALRNLKLVHSSRRWNIWLTLIGMDKNPTAPSGRVLHLSVCNVLGHPSFKVGPLCNHEHRSHIPRGEKQGVAWFCCSVVEHLSWGERLVFQSLLLELFLYVVQGGAHLKCPRIAVRKGTKNFLGSSGIASTGRRDCPPSCSISWHSPWKSWMWRKSLEEGSETRSPSYQLCVCDQKLLLTNGTRQHQPYFLFSPLS